MNRPVIVIYGLIYQKKSREDKMVLHILLIILKIIQLFYRQLLALQLKALLFESKVTTCLIFLKRELKISSQNQQRLHIIRALFLLVYYIGEKTIINIPQPSWPSTQQKRSKMIYCKLAKKYFSRLMGKQNNQKRGTAILLLQCPPFTRLNYFVRPCPRVWVSRK